MNNNNLLYRLSWICLAGVLLLSCEDVIDVELPPSEERIVVDAWITDSPLPQIIELQRSQPYFEGTDPGGISGATVEVRRMDGKVFIFGEASGGRYIWNPSNSETLGSVGDSYELFLEISGEVYTARTEMHRVPTVDSITQEFRDDDFILDDGIYLEFFSRDFSGLGDAYWIKTYKNGEYLDKGEEINLAFDAGFDPGTGIDGLIFIPPIRDLINPLDEDLIPQPWNPGDRIRVEIHSISREAFSFMEIARDQITNGNNTIFALPLANTGSNIRHENGNQQVLGFFNVAAVSSGEKVVE